MQKDDHNRDVYLLCRLQVRIGAIREILVVLQFALVLISQTCIPNVNHDIVESRYPTGQIVTSGRSQRLLCSETIRVEKSLYQYEVVQMFIQLFLAKSPAHPSLLWSISASHPD